MRPLVTKLILLLVVGTPAWVAAAPAGKRVVRAKPRMTLGQKAPRLPATKRLVAPVVRRAPVRPPENETPPPAPNDPDRERVLRLQEALSSIVHGPVLGRLHVGIQVRELNNDRVLYERRPATLMDPASNQKVLATATALLRLGASWRYRTELLGGQPDAHGEIEGDLILQGTGDPSLRGAHIERLAAQLARNGVTRIKGGVLGARTRIGADEADARPPLRVGRAAIEVRVRPGVSDGERPYVTVRPASDAFVVVNRATTRGRGRSRLGVSLASDGGRLQVIVTGRIPRQHPGHVLRRVPGNQTLYAAVLLRSALVSAGIDVQGGAGVYVPRPPAGRYDLDARGPTRFPVLLAMVGAGADVRPRDDVDRTVLAVHESDPLPLIMRRINKDSDNEYAERLLETVGAEIYGGAATQAKGLRALREAMTELGIPAAAYLPANGSGLGHHNRISATAMADLLARLFHDPRIGPDMLQSLSVGGVDGTTRNRFRGSPAAERVRAKTGTLNGKSILSGYVGDGSDILVFSIFVQGMRPRAVSNVRHAQVSAVNAMMRYVRGAVGPTPGEEVAPGTDYESVEDAADRESETEEAPAAEAPTAAAPLIDRIVEGGLRSVATGSSSKLVPPPAAPALPVPGNAR